MSVQTWNLWASPGSTFSPRKGVSKGDTIRPTQKQTKLIDLLDGSTWNQVVKKGRLFQGERWPLAIEKPRHPLPWQPNTPSVTFTCSQFHGPSSTCCNGLLEKNPDGKSFKYDLQRLQKPLPPTITWRNLSYNKLNSPKEEIWKETHMWNGLVL